MIEIKKSYKIDAPTKDVYKALVAYSRYPKYMMGIQKARVRKKLDKSKALVVYNISLFGKDLTYVLKMNEKTNTSLSWTLHESTYMNHNSGKWTLKSNGNGSTSVQYNLKIKLNFHIPAFLLKRGAQSQVKKLHTHFKTYCETGETIPNEEI